MLNIYFIPFILPLFTLLATTIVKLEVLHPIGLDIVVPYGKI